MNTILLGHSQQGGYVKERTNEMVYHGFSPPIIMGGAGNFEVNYHGGLSLTFIILGGPGLMGGVSIMMGGAAILRAENHSCAKFLRRTINLT